MDKQKVVVTTLLLIVVVVVILFLCCTSTTALAPNEPGTSSSSSPLTPIAKFQSQWANLINRLQSYLFPPNLDFRGTTSTGTSWTADSSGVGGAGEKVKEAVAKSLGKSKAAVEDSAKSAANKLKQSLGPHPQTDEL